MAGEDGPLGLADLEAYRAAIDPASPGVPAPAPAAFRDLWDRPAEFQGRRVAVGGRVERVFHQGAFGKFPALAEVWVVDAATDPLCLVFPESSDHPAPKPGDRVRFDGTFLRRIRYRGGDVDRFAPLVVGPGAPRVERPALIGPAGVAIALRGGRGRGARRDGRPRALEGPSSPADRAARSSIDPPPEFHDGHPAGYDGEVGVDESGRG